MDSIRSYIRGVSNLTSGANLVADASSAGGIVNCAIITMYGTCHTSGTNTISGALVNLGDTRRTIIDGLRLKALVGCIDLIGGGAIAQDAITNGAFKRYSLCIPIGYTEGSRVITLRLQMPTLDYAMSASGFGFGLAYMDEFADYGPLSYRSKDVYVTSGTKGDVSFAMSAGESLRALILHDLPSTDATWPNGSTNARALSEVNGDFGGVPINANWDSLEAFSMARMQSGMTGSRSATSGITTGIPVHDCVCIGYSRGYCNGANLTITGGATGYVQAIGLIEGTARVKSAAQAKVADMAVSGRRVLARSNQ